MLPFIDLHQDLLLHIRERHLFDDDQQTDLSLNIKAGVKVVVATAFPYPPDGDFKHPSINELIEGYIDSYNEIASQGGDERWGVITDAAGLEEVVTGRSNPGFIVSVEGLNMFEGSSEDWEMLDRWYEKGLRSIGPLWSVSNSLGGSADDGDKGLTSLGEELIRWAEDRGVVVDLAHMNRKTFRESVSKITKPAFVSHANADTVCPSERNLEDWQLEQIAEYEGVVGVFCAVKFLDESKDRSSINSLVKHIKYIKDLIGIEHVAVGTDFGGLTNGSPKGLPSVDHIPRLWELLSEEGLSGKEIEAISYGNSLRVLKEHLG